MMRGLESDFDVIMPDARGHGRSSAPASGYTYGELAADVIALIGDLGLVAPVLLGHSMGGLTAAVVASQLGSVLSGLVLLDPTFISPEWQREAFDSEIAPEHEEMLKLEPSHLIARARLRSPGRSDEVISHLVDARLRTSVQAFEILRPPNPNYRELVAHIRVPTLLVIGERGVVASKTATELETLNPMLSVVHIGDAGHGMPYDEPQRLGLVIQTFLRNLVIVNGQIVTAEQA
jgi:pimeloyl-ACP methyl ester carboxylesterase